MVATPQRRDDGTNDPHATGAQARSATDAGLTGDKIPYADPAASPLGTDSEAAGQRPSPADVPPQPAVGVPAGRAKGHELPARTTLGIGVVSALVAAAVAVLLAALFL